jgi:L-lactate dehydrogenase
MRFSMSMHSKAKRTNLRVCGDACAGYYMGGKVAVVGAGFVGSTAAYAMFIQKTASEIALIDANKEKAKGNALDLEHGAMFASHTKIRYGSDYALCKDADVVVLALGAGQSAPGMTRLDLVQKNAAIFRDVVPKIERHAPEAIVMVVTNPVDALTYLTLKYSKYLPSRVFGTGTSLDTARLRHMLGEHFKIDPKSVHAYVLGEHGDSSFPVWSCANIAGIPLSKMPRYKKNEVEGLSDKVRKAAYEIIAGKGATYYAIGMVIADLAYAVLNDRKAVYPVSTLLHDYHGVSDTCVSVPCVIGRNGVEKRLLMPLDAREKACLRKSAGIVKAAVAKAK